MLEFTVDEAPYQAGIDPRNLMIDRMPDDNLKNITLVNSIAQSIAKTE